jgi:hypothetical protein
MRRGRRVDDEVDVDVPAPVEAVMTGSVAITVEMMVPGGMPRFPDAQPVTNVVSATAAAPIRREEGVVMCRPLARTTPAIRLWLSHCRTEPYQFCEHRAPRALSYFTNSRLPASIDEAATRIH